MVDTDFERAMQANLAPVDEYIDDLIAKASPLWKGVDADAFMDMVRGREPGTITEQLAAISEDWAVVLSEKPEPKPDCCADTGGWENLVWVNKITENA